MAEVFLCYGTFFTVVSAFKKTNVVNNWQLHNRLMNIEHIPFGDFKNAYPLTGKEFEERSAAKDNYNSNPSERINDFANCKQTKTLPIQGSGSKTEHRFLNTFLDSEMHSKILQYVKTQIITCLDEGKETNVTKAIIELLGLAMISDDTEFYIDANVTKTTTKDKIVNERSQFDLSGLIAGVLYYIVKHCSDNTVGKLTIEEWKTSTIPDGTRIARVIEVVDFNDSIDEQNKDFKKGKNTVINYGHIENQKIVNIEKVTGNVHF